MFPNSKTKQCLLLLVSVIVLTLSCTRQAEEIDLANNESHKHQAFNQIIDNPELQQEFMVKLMNNEQAMKRMMRDREFLNEFFKEKNMNYIWDQNPGIDSAVIDNVTT